MHAVLSSSSDERVILSGPGAEQPDSVTPCALVNTPVTLDLSIVCIAVTTLWWRPFPGPFPQRVVSASNRCIRLVRLVAVPVAAVVESLNR